MLNLGRQFRVSHPRERATNALLPPKPSSYPPPARGLAAETLNLERTLSDLINQAYALTPAEIDLMWQTAPPRMPIPPPICNMDLPRTRPGLVNP